MKYFWKTDQYLYDIRIHASKPVPTHFTSVGHRGVSDTLGTGIRSCLSDESFRKAIKYRLIYSMPCFHPTIWTHIRIVFDLSAPTLIPPSFTHRSIEVTLGQLYAEKYTPVLTYLGIPISHYLLYVDDHYTYLVYPFLSVLLINYHEPLESPRLRNNCGHEPVHSQGCIEL